MQSDFLKKLDYLNDKIFKSLDALCEFFNITKRSYFSYKKKNLHEPSKQFLNYLQMNLFNDKVKKQLFNNLDVCYLDFKADVSYKEFKNKIDIYLDKQNKEANRLNVTNYFLYIYLKKNELKRFNFRIRKIDDKYKFEIDNDFMYKDGNCSEILFTDNQIIFSWIPKKESRYYSLNLEKHKISDELIFFLGYLSYYENDIFITNKVVVTPYEFFDNNKLNILIKNRRISFTQDYINLVKQEYLFPNDNVSKQTIYNYLNYIEESSYSRIIEYINMLQDIDKSIYLEFYKKEHKVLLELSKKITSNHPYIQDNILRTGNTIIRNIHKFSNSCYFFTTIKDKHSIFIQEHDSKNNEQVKEYMKYTKEIFEKNNGFIFKRIYCINNIHIAKKLFPIINEQLSYSKNMEVYIYISLDNFQKITYQELAVDIEQTFSAFVLNSDIQKKSYITDDKQEIKNIYNEFIYMQNKSNCFKIVNKDYKDYKSFINENSKMFVELQKAYKNSKFFLNSPHHSNL